jgi:pimeloyl-ACP methyl ester carboxylesterase
MVYFNFAKNIENLTELTSIDLVQKIQSKLLNTSLSQENINTTYIQEKGAKPPILLLHGFDSSLLEFRRLIPLLSEKYEVWAVDLLGFGFTERKLDLAYDPLSIKTHLYHFWKSLIQQPVTLVGASMGGATALDFTLSYPEAVTKLVLLDSGGLTKKPIMSKFIFPPLDFLATQFLQNPQVRLNISRAAYYNKNLANQDALTCANLHLKCSGWSQALISFTKSGGYGNFNDLLTKIEQPTLIIWGENDQILGTKLAAKFKGLIRHSKLLWISQCGHVPHLEKPQIIANYITEFIPQ